MFFNIFKNKKEEKYVTFEKQIERLEQIGIRINPQIPMDELFKVMRKDEIENNPFLFLLIAIVANMKLKKINGLVFQMIYGIWIRNALKIMVIT